MTELFHNQIATYQLSRAIKRLKSEYFAFILEKNDNIKIAYDESNSLKWHFIFIGEIGTVYECGKYHGSLKFPPDFPFSPPSIFMHTPNGRFKIGERLCLSLSDFHPEVWKPGYRVASILYGLYTFMMSENTPTIGSLDLPDNDKIRLAKESQCYFAQNNEIDRLFYFNPNYSELHTSIASINNVTSSKYPVINTNNDTSMPLNITKTDILLNGDDEISLKDSKKLSQTVNQLNNYKVCLQKVNITSVSRTTRKKSSQNSMISNITAKYRALTISSNSKSQKEKSPKKQKKIVNESTIMTRSKTNALNELYNTNKMNLKKKS